MKRLNTRNFADHVDVGTEFFDPAENRNIVVDSISPGSRTAGCTVTEYICDDDENWSIHSYGTCFTFSELCSLEIYAPVWRTWYAILANPCDDYSTGTFDRDEAIEALWDEIEYGNPNASVAAIVNDPDGENVCIEIIRARDIQ